MSLAFSPDSSYVASGGAKGDMLFWSPRMPRGPVERMGPHGGPVRTIAFAPSTRPIRVATAAGDGVVRIWTQTAGTPAVETVPVGTGVYAVAFSPDGTRLAIGDTSVVRVLGTESGKPDGSQQTLDAADVLALAFSADGTLLVTGDRAGVVRLWDLVRGAELQHVQVPGPVGSVSLTGEATYIGVGHAQGTSWTPVTVAVTGSTPAVPPTFSSGDVRAMACSQAAEARSPPTNGRGISVPSRSASPAGRSRPRLRRPRIPGSSRGPQRGLADLGRRLSRPPRRRKIVTHARFLLRTLPLPRRPRPQVGARLLGRVLLPPEEGLRRPMEAGR